MTNHLLWGSVRPALLAMAVSCLILVAPIRAAILSDSSATPSPVHPAITKVSKTTTSSGSATTAALPTPSSTPPATTVVKPSAAAVTPVAPNCAPDTTYSGPDTIDLTNSSAGLTTTVNPTHYYQVNGYTNTQIRQQIASCAPKLSGDDDFTGYTTYRLSWQLNYAVTNAGSCTVASPKIGIDIAEVLPDWQASPYATPGLASQWATFVANLDAHEHGHVTLDEQYAAEIVTSLQVLPATDCGSISAQANAIITNGVAALDAANVTYDNQTNHGATQGAILP